MQVEPITSTLFEMLASAQKESFALLQRFLDGDDFEDQLQIAFGSSIDAAPLATFIEDIILGRELLRVAILEGSELNGSYGAFDRSSGTIYLSKDFLLKNSADPARISAVLLEEFGHLLDSRYNRTDAPGDEGAIFAQLVTGTPVTEARVLKNRWQPWGLTGATN
jgi:hypothetical protein